MIPASFLYKAQVFAQLFRRDAYVYWKDASRFVIDYAFCYPLLYAFCFAYIQARIFFGTNATTTGTMMFAGNIIIPILLVTYKQAVTLLFDFEGDRFVDYQTSVLSPRLWIVQRILFSSLFTFALTCPFYPVTKLVLGNILDTSNTNWLNLMFMLYFSSLAMASYHLMAICILKNTSSITHLWARANHLLITFGGFWVPLHIMDAYSPILGNLARINPLLYVSEGIRQAIIGGDQFMSLSRCTAALLGFTVVFTIVTWIVFKRRIDHI